MLLAPLDAFQPCLLRMRMQFDPVCFVGSLPSKPRMGHGLGQAETDSSKKLRISNYAATVA